MTKTVAKRPQGGWETRRQQVSIWGPAEKKKGIKCGRHGPLGQNGGFAASGEKSDAPHGPQKLIVHGNMNIPG